MNKRKIKGLFALLAATLVLTGVNYNINTEKSVVYGAEVEAESKEKVDIDVTYASEEITNNINPSIVITNSSDEELNLKDLDLKYFGVCEDDKEQIADIYYAGIKEGEYKELTSNVNLAVKESDENYDKYLDITFNGGILKSGESMTIQLGIHNKEWLTFSNIDKSKLSISGYKDGKLIYGEEKCKVKESEKVMMSLGEEQEFNEYDYYKSVPLYAESLEQWDKIDSINLEIKYDPDQVKLYFLENWNGLVKYTDDRENGIVKITYIPKAEKADDSDEKGMLCRINFKDLNGGMGSESDVTISGTASYKNEPEKVVNIESINQGKVTFKKDENIDLSMPVLETNKIAIDLGRDAVIKVNENGHKLLGIKGLEEGKEYTWDGKFLSINGQYLKQFRSDYGVNLYLEFEDNIKKVFTVGFLLIEPAVDYPSVYPESAEVEQGDNFKYNIKVACIRELSKGDEFNLLYDSDMFDVNDIKCEEDNSLFKYEINNEKGVIHCYYEGEDYKNDKKVNLVLDLSLKEKYGDTRFGIENINAPVHWSSAELIKINKKDPVEVKEPEFSDESIAYIPGFDDDVKFNVKLNGNRFLGITERGISGKKEVELVEGKDYFMKYDKDTDEYQVTIKEDVIENSRYNNSGIFNFNFSNNIQKTINVGMLYPELPYGTTLSITGQEGKNDDTLYSTISLRPDSSIKSVDGYSLDIRYSPDEVTAVEVIPLIKGFYSEGFKYTIDNEKGKIYVKCSDELNCAKSKVLLCKVAFKNNKGEKEAISTIGAGATLYSDGEEAFATGVSGKIKFKEFNPYENIKIPVVCRADAPVDSEGNLLDNHPLLYSFDGSDINVAIYSDDVKFEGIEGLEEGIDYTFNGLNNVKIKSSALEKFKNEDSHYFSFKFDNNIKRVLPVLYDKMGIQEYFNVNIGDMKNEKSVSRKNLIMVPVKVSNNVGDILTKCDFDLKYDKDIFRDAYIICNDEKVKSNVDLENGVINVTYDRQDPELSVEKASDPIYGAQIEFYLALQVREDASIGDTVIGFENNTGFEIRNSFNGDVVVNQGLISVKPVQE